MEYDENCIPKVSLYFRIDKEMHVIRYCNIYPVPLPLCSRKGEACRLTSITQLENFPSYLTAKQEEFSSSLAEELEKNTSSELPTLYK